MTRYEALEVAHDILLERIGVLQNVYANHPKPVRYELAQTKGAARVIVEMLHEIEEIGIE